jgi:DNA-directed RNA polymerase subunit N (RpoN/RPB10)
MAACFRCGTVLSHDEKAVYKRLVNRGAEEYLCAACLAAHFKVPETMIWDKVRQYRDMGCSLF